MSNYPPYDPLKYLEQAITGETYRAICPAMKIDVEKLHELAPDVPVEVIQAAYAIGVSKALDALLCDLDARYTDCAADTRAACLEAIKRKTQ